jgi:hypothetical protein
VRSWYTQVDPQNLNGSHKKHKEYPQIMQIASPIEFHRFTYVTHRIIWISGSQKWPKNMRGSHNHTDTSQLLAHIKLMITTKVVPTSSLPSHIVNLSLLDLIASLPTSGVWLAKSTWLFQSNRTPNFFLQHYVLLYKIYRPEPLLRPELKKCIKNIKIHQKSVYTKSCKHYKFNNKYFLEHNNNCHCSWWMI